jgi:hypothetical protein
MMSVHEFMCKYKWTVRYIAVVVTLIFILQILEVVL